MCSNVFFAMRSIMRKNLPKDFKARTNLSDPANEHALTTVLSSLMILPFALSFDSVPNMVSTVAAMYVMWISSICFQDYYSVQLLH